MTSYQRKTKKVRLINKGLQLIATKQINHCDFYVLQFIAHDLFWNKELELKVFLHSSKQVFCLPKTKLMLSISKLKVLNIIDCNCLDENTNCYTITFTQKLIENEQKI
jgi:hypothetical protein